MERADLEQWTAREVARLLALVETERRYYQEIVASIPVGLLVVSTDLAIVSSNRAIRKIFGLRSSEPVRGRLDALLPGWVLDRVDVVLKTGVPQTNILVESEHRGKRRLRIGILAIRSWDDETVQEALLTIEDLTGLELAELATRSVGPAAGHEPSAAVPVPSSGAKALPASERIDDLNAVVWAVELRGTRFSFVSRYAERLLGFPADHWMSSASFWTDRVHPADRDAVLASYQQAIERGEGTVEFRAVAADGRMVWLRESARVLTDSQGRPRSLIGVSVDVTERRVLEDQLVQSERVQAMSKLAARMAHDLNNMLMIVTGHSEELLNSIPPDSSLGADVQAILTATERMSALTAQLLVFARRQSAPRSIVELETVLRALEPRLSAAMGKQFQLEFKLSGEPSRVQADAQQLEQVILSLVERERQVMRGGGQITIETSRVEIREDLRRSGALRPGTYGVITIAHPGPAIEGEAQTSLFESVLPGKDPADDSVAAVTRAYGVVRQWGGDISVSPAPRGGSLFRVFLELVEDSGERARPTGQRTVGPAAPEAQRETILVVEDETGIRELVQKILGRHGYTVLEAANGDEALEICRQRSVSIDLLITDVMMPRMGGRELVDRLRKQGRKMKVLYVSGYTDDVSIYSGNFPPGTAFLQKPFTLSALLDKVREVLRAKLD